MFSGDDPVWSNVIACPSESVKKEAMSTSMGSVSNATMGGTFLLSGLLLPGVNRENVVYMYGGEEKEP